MMKHFFLIAVTMISFFGVSAQKTTGDTTGGTATMIKDPRVDILGKKMADYNDDLSMRPHSGKGYRLMVLNTSDRDLAMKVRSQLYQLYPDQKQYLTYQLPNIKVKFGNFIDKADAEKVRKQLADLKIVTTNIYVLPETIEIKPEKKPKDAKATDDRK